MQLGTQNISNFGRPYIIAEIGANHNGDMELCKKIIRAAKDSGAHCAKFQSWTKTTLFSSGMYKGNVDLERQIDTYAISEKQVREMRDFCREVKIDFASSVFCERETDFLRGARVAELLGSYTRLLSDEDFSKVPTFRRSVIAARAIPAGHKIQATNLICKRPGSGIEPRYLNFIVGRTARRNIGADELITPEDF